MAASPLGGEAEDDRRAGYCLGETCIVGWQSLGAVGQCGEFGRSRKLSREGVGRQAVGLGQDEVEGNDFGAGILEFGNDLGEACPWPRPLTDLFQRRLVDVDDSDRVGGIGNAGREVQVMVEYGKTQTRNRRRVGDAQQHGQRKECGRQNCLDP